MQPLNCHVVWLPSLQAVSATGKQAMQATLVVSPLSSVHTTQSPRFNSIPNVGVHAVSLGQHKEQQQNYTAQQPGIILYQPAMAGLGFCL